MPSNGMLFFMSLQMTTDEYALVSNKSQVVVPELPTYVAKFLSIVKDAAVHLHIKSLAPGKEGQPNQPQKVDVLPKESAVRETRTVNNNVHDEEKNDELASGLPKECQHGKEAGIKSIESCEKHATDANTQSKSLLGHTTTAQDGSSSVLCTDNSIGNKNVVVVDAVDRTMPSKPRRITPVAILTNSTPPPVKTLDAEAK